MVVLEQDMRQEASLCPVQHHMVVLVWEASKSDQMVEEVPVAHIGEVNKKGKSQRAVELADDAWEAFN